MLPLKSSFSPKAGVKQQDKIKRDTSDLIIIIIITT